MNKWRRIMSISIIAVSIVMVAGCGEETQSTAGTFFDVIDASAGEVNDSEAITSASQLEQEAQAKAEQTDTQSVQQDRIENKNQSAEMSYQAIQSSKLPSRPEQKQNIESENASDTVEQAEQASIDGKGSYPSTGSSDGSSSESSDGSSRASSGESSRASNGGPGSASSDGSSNGSSSGSSGTTSSESSSGSSGTTSSESGSGSGSTTSGTTSNGTGGTTSSASSGGSSSGTSSGTSSASSSGTSGTTSSTTSSGSSSTTSAASTKGKNEIYWSEFFDNDDQTTPSNTFWDLSDNEATVQIKGFMGEVLSLDKNWFLLIPEPGAECPFDNGDETYWNKIMIVFVDEDVKLRYTSKPLQVTGKLDVGIKIDESGYKTMFRLYDATFKEI